MRVSGISDETVPKEESRQMMLRHFPRAMVRMRGISEHPAAEEASEERRPLHL